MRRIISFLLVIAMISVSGFAMDYSQQIEALKAVNIETDGTRDVDSIVTRQEFAQAAAMLHGSKVCEPKATAFSDVDAENEYSGYINYLVSNKLITPGGEFRPGDGADATFVYELILNILGYAKYATDVDAVAFATSQLQLNQYTEFKDGFLTYGGMIGLLFGTLETNMPELSYEIGNGQNVENMAVGASVYLTEMLDLSVYKGTVKEADRKKYRVTLDITESVYSSNKLKLGVGSEYTFDASTTIDISKYENVPIVVWVDANEDVITMYPQRDYKVMYAPVYSVNDNNKSVKFPVKNINRLMLWDDETEYKVLPTAQMRSNGKMVTGDIKLAGSYAKLVVKDEDEVIFVETWDITEGGIVTEITENALTFQRGTSTTKISPLNSYYNTIAIINDESRDFADLKTNTYIDYYRDLKTGTLVIFAKEDILTNELSSLGENSLNLGGIHYQLADKFYFAGENGKYAVATRQKLLSAAGQNVAVHLNTMRECVYIKLISDEEAAKNEFFGVLMGSKTEIFGSAKIAVMNIEGTPEKKIYDLTSKAKYVKSDGTTVAATEAPVYTEGGNGGIYLFKLNAKGQISTITYPPGVYGFTDGNGDTKGLVNMSDAKAYMNVNTADGDNYKYLPIDSTLPLYVMYHNYFTGELEILATKRTNYTYFSGSKSSTDSAATIFTRAFGYENTPEVRLMLLTSNNNFDSFKNWNKKYGLIKRGGESMVDEDGNILNNFIIIAKDTETEITLSDEVSALMPDMAFVQYYTPHTFGVSGAYLGLDAATIATNTIVDLSGAFPTWTDDEDLQRGVVKSKHSDIVIFEGDDGYSTASTMFICEVGRTGNDGFPMLTQISMDELNVGDTVYYILSTNSNNAKQSRQILVMFVDRT
ncbi:MAG: hypothetical protein Q4A86_02350 [Clostridia bacterium]|nr:hypothetical protein [Clostridia bacterium]